MKKLKDLICFLKVLEINPTTQKLVSKVPFDGMATNITSVAFGGDDLRDLYVTTAKDDSGQGGQLFVVRETGAQGLPGRFFNPAAK